MVTANNTCGAEQIVTLLPMIAMTLGPRTAGRYRLPHSPVEHAQHFSGAILVRQVPSTNTTRLMTTDRWSQGLSWMEINSTSKTSVAFGPTALPAPRSP